MKACTFVIAILVSLTATAVGDEMDGTIKQEQEKLQGKWRQFSIETRGQVKEVSPNVNVILTIDGDKWTTENRMGKLESTAKIDPIHEPKFLDRIRKGKDGKADEPGEESIYKVDKDTLTICIARSVSAGKLENGKGRPKEFKTTEGGTILVFKRLARY